MAVVLLVLAMVAVVAFAASTLGVQDLNLARKGSLNAQAKFAAEAGLSRKLAALSEDSDDVAPIAKTQVVGSSNAFYEVEVRDNTSGSAPVAGITTSQVPPGCMEIVSTGTVAGTRQVVSILVTSKWTGWGYGLAGTGEVKADKDLEVSGASDVAGAIASLDDPEGGNIPGSVYGGKKVALKGGHYVGGGLKSPGKIKYDPEKGTIVHGTVKGSEELPSMDVAWPKVDSSDPGYKEIKDGKYDKPAAFPADAPGKTVLYIDGDVEFKKGLDLKGVTLIIKGKLKVDGTLRMTDASIYTSKEIEVEDGVEGSHGVGSASGAIYMLADKKSKKLEIKKGSGLAGFDASNTQGLLLYSRGRIRLEKGSAYQGAAYAVHDLHLEKGVRFLGSVVVNNQHSKSKKAKGKIKVHSDVKVVFTRTYNKIWSDKALPKKAFDITSYY